MNKLLAVVLVAILCGCGSPRLYFYPSPYGGYFYMDRIDHSHVERILETTRNGDTKAWHNPNSNVVYIITPVITTIRANGQPCREYIIVRRLAPDGAEQQSRGFACRQDDQSWIVNRG